MKRVVSLAVLVVLLTGCTQLSAEEIAKKVEEKYDTVKDLKGILRVTAEGKSGNFTIEYEYVFKKPNKAKMYNEKFGTLIVTNGEKTWIYNERENEVKIIEGRYSVTDPDYGKFVKDVLDRYNVDLLGSETFSGRECYVLRLTPKDNKSIEMKMWVDKEFWYPLKIEYILQGIKSTVEYLDVKFNTGVSDEEFNFTPSEGAKIRTEGVKKFDSVEEAQKHVDFKILKPTYTAGYKLKEVSLLTASVSLRYVKDDETLTIIEAKGDMPEMQDAEKVKIGESEGLYAEIYGSSVLVFKKGDIVVTITGVVGKEELIRIAESME